jgi:hypothetical protein
MAPQERRPSFYHTSQFSSHWLKWAINLGRLRYSHFAQTHTLEDVW